MFVHGCLYWGWQGRGLVGKGKVGRNRVALPALTDALFTNKHSVAVQGDGRENVPGGGHHLGEEDGPGRDLPLLLGEQECVSSYIHTYIHVCVSL